MVAFPASSTTVSSWQPETALEPSLDENIRARRKGFQLPLRGRDFGGHPGCGQEGNKQADEARPYAGGICKIAHACARALIFTTKQRPFRATEDTKPRAL